MLSYFYAIVALNELKTNLSLNKRNQQSHHQNQHLIHLKIKVIVRFEIESVSYLKPTPFRTNTLLMEFNVFIFINSW